MQYVDAFFDTARIGGAVAGVVIVTLVVCYSLTIKWISKGHEDKTERH